MNEVLHRVTLVLVLGGLVPGVDGNDGGRLGLFGAGGGRVVVQLKSKKGKKEWVQSEIM